MVGRGGRLYSLAFSPDGEVAARVDLAGPAGSRTEVSDLAVAPSGEVLVPAAGDRLVTLSWTDDRITVWERR